MPRARLEVAGVVLPTVASSVYYLVLEPDGLAGKFPIQAFRTKYAPPRESARSAGPDEKIALTHAGLRRLGRAPAIGVQLGSPPQIRTESTNRYLWVIDDTGIPYIRELPIYALHGKLPKHTNLTAGGLAYVAGELWFSDDSCLFLSGGFGRYPPRNAEHLGDAVRVFEFYGYGVTSLGWDTDHDTAQRAFMK